MFSVSCVSPFSNFDSDVLTSSMIAKRRTDLNTKLFSAE